VLDSDKDYWIDFNNSNLSFVFWLCYYYWW
jgi:hypothetical protein